MCVYAQLAACQRLSFSESAHVKRQLLAGNTNSFKRFFLGKPAVTHNYCFPMLVLHRYSPEFATYTTAVTPWMQNKKLRSIVPQLPLAARGLVLGDKLSLDEG
jgi:hypothetical protein